MLRYHRDTLAMKCDGLTHEQLCTRSVPPSSMSLIGLVRHMAEVERSWFQGLVAGKDRTEAPMIYCSDQRLDGDFDEAIDGSTGAICARSPEEEPKEWSLAFTHAVRAAR